jgi:hypothetical protein
MQKGRLQYRRVAVGVGQLQHSNRWRVVQGFSYGIAVDPEGVKGYRYPHRTPYVGQGNLTISSHNLAARVAQRRPKPPSAA